MSDEDRYRRHGKFCREHASLLRGAERERWIHLADEYDRLAEGHRALYTQQQEQQQQSTKEDEN